MKVLIAPNAMKGSLSAVEFAAAIAEGLIQANPDWELVIKPIADGGDGTLEVLLNTLDGEYITEFCHDPLGRDIISRYGWISKTNTAVIEMAEASGLKLLSSEEYNPLVASTRGTGDLINAAVKKGAEKIILGIGGSATVDGGTGMLKALGFSLLDKFGNEIQEGGGGLSHLKTIKFDKAHSAFNDCEIYIASDVTNQLFGENGGVEVYSPQKGASREVIDNITSGFENYLDVIKTTKGKDLTDLIGGGAAGGVAIPLVAFLDAKMISGAELVLNLSGLNANLEYFDLIITGEGCVDDQTFNGKGAAAVAKLARNAGVPIIAIGGIVKAEASPLFNGIYSICNGPITLGDAMAHAYDLTKNLCYELGKSISILK